ncbi:hypothetical protein Golomagni_06711 [Golovinomyces magnicellulatus]|nr:hypothetical protein Golomagni_06711 [Golovinomyces magnicellulatus]
MAFFPRNFYNTTEASFTPLFRLLDDFDTYSRQNGSQSCTTKKSYLPSWQPKFDVREVEDAYELHGELPGVAKENVHIEFTDPQTMTIRGKAERSYTAGTPPAADREDSESVASISDSEETKSNSHQATVADEDENEAQEAGTPTQEVATPAPTKPTDTAKYWLTERSIGEFSRSFNFPSRVEQDSVSASFKDGILSVSVPKAKKHESRRIAIV